MKGFTKGKGKGKKFIPTARKSQTLSKDDMKKFDRTRSQVQIANNKIAQELRQKKTLEVPAIDITHQNFGFEMDHSGMRLSLDQFMWRWSGDEDDIIGWLLRMVGTVEDKDSAFNSFEENFEKKGGTFETLKPFMLKSVKELDGLYQISGDNNRWNNSDDEDNFDVDSELEHWINENDDTKDKLDESDKDEILEGVWKHLKYENYEDYEKENKSWYLENMTKAIKESNSFDDFIAEAEGMAEADMDSRREASDERMFTAFGISVDEVLAKKKKDS